MFQFWFLQLLILMGAFGKGAWKAGAQVSGRKRLQTKSFLFVTEGVLLLAIAWIWKEEPEQVPAFYLVAGVIWLIAGIITYLYMVRRCNGTVQ